MISKATLFLIPALVGALALPVAAAPGKGRGHGKDLKQMDTNSDGKVSKEEWKGDANAFAKRDRNSDGFLDEADAKAAREAQFAKQDLNSDGKLAKDEWKGKEKQFSRMDRNGDGFVEKSEMTGRGRK